MTAEAHYLDALEALEADEREEALQHARKAVKLDQNMLMHGELSLMRVFPD